MPAPLRKPALIPGSALILLIAFIFLSGCSSNDAEKFGSAAGKAADAIAHGLTADERAAIQAVGKSLAAATHDLNSKPESLDSIKTTMKGFYSVLSEADVSACPADFRAQFHKVVLSAAAFNDTLDDVPAGDAEQLGYLISQLGSSQPDFEGKQLVRGVQEKLQDLMYQLSELKAVAHKYDADQDF